MAGSRGVGGEKGRRHKGKHGKGGLNGGNEGVPEWREEGAGGRGSKRANTGEVRERLVGVGEVREVAVGR